MRCTFCILIVILPYWRTKEQLEFAVLGRHTGDATGRPAEDKLRDVLLAGTMT